MCVKRNLEFAQCLIYFENETLLIIMCIKRSLEFDEGLIYFENEVTIFFL